MAIVKETVSGAWAAMDRGVRLAVIGATVLALAAIVWGSYALLRDDYGTLFSDLSDTDAAAIVAALKSKKIPYRLSESGNAISVPMDRVHDTRLELMSSDVPLTGGVGFEIFDKQGLGTTEQSQRVSFQRALQGELARTISSLENVKQARVHLVLPETSLFKRDRQEASAAITVITESGHSLDRQQILGVQRLVAASVAGLDPTHVVITDQRGITLSTSGPMSEGIAGIESRLELQQEAEAHISKKLARLLDSAIGPGKAIVSVSVSLSFDAVKSTTQDLLPVRGGNDGGLVRKRQVTSSSGAAQTGATTDSVQGNASSTRGNSTVEVEYEYGRHVEEIIGSPGTVRRITVGVVVPENMAEDQLKQIRELIQVAAGIDTNRGDAVSVQTLGQAYLDSDSGASVARTDEQPEGAQAANRFEEPQPARNDRYAYWLSRLGSIPTGAVALIGLLLLIVIGAWLGLGRRTRKLTLDQRQKLLEEIRHTLSDDNKPVQARVGS